ncbi:MAG: carboxypeptidase-like regulatory domain-containing protein [Ignavibacteriae bacterium]|nr:carboxypeptidase-like regulatory domain-containing protein [Ignavibacteriota bacterium]
MFKRVFFLFLFFAFIIATAYSQTYRLTGKISDSKTGKPLSFASVKIADTTYGTTSDQNGEFILRLGKGYFKAIISYIGYFSDTASVFIDSKDEERNIFLKPTEIITEEIEVLGEDPAYDIIRKAINYKKLFQSRLYEYDYDAYSKFVIRSNVGTSTDKDTLKKSSDLDIFGILESETKGYFKKPDIEKQIVISKKETANIRKGFAIPLIVNFYDEKIELNDVKIPGPLSDDAFDSYEYKLAKVTSMDSLRIFKINVINTSNLVPQFAGNIYIVDSIYALLKVDLKTNDAGLPRGIDNLEFLQKFTSYKDKAKNNFWMPTDVEIFADGSFMGLIKFKGEVFTIVSNYNLNVKAPKGTFDDIVIKILPDASKKDSSYWSANQIIKNTDEEKRAFDKIAKDEAGKEKSVAFGFTSLKFGKDLSMDLLDLYSFNRVKGHQLGLDLHYNRNFGKYVFNTYLGYGFGDKKGEYEIEARLRMLKDRNLWVNIKFYEILNAAFLNERTSSRIFENTFYTLFYKKDRENYYYGNGYSLYISKTLFPHFRFGLLYSQEKQTSAFKHSDYSILKKSHLYSENPLINDAFRRKTGFEIRIDPNNYYGIDWGDGEITRFRNTEYPRLTLKYEYSSKELGSTYDYGRFSFNFYGQSRFNSYLNIKYRIGGVIMNGTVPYQDLAFFSTRSHISPELMPFIVMDYNEYLGDKLLFINFENNFGRILWGNVPLIKRFDLIGFLNAGKTEISSTNRKFLGTGYPFNPSTTDGMYMEAGFAIDKILEVSKLSLAWRLNNLKSGKNFFIIYSINL